MAKKVNLTISFIPAPGDAGEFVQKLRATSQVSCYGGGDRV